MKGIKYVGPVEDFSGYAEAARNYISSLDAHGVPLTVHPRNFDVNPPPIADPRMRSLLDNLIGAGTPYDKVIIHLTPDLYPLYAERGKHNIGFVAWETSLLHPKWAASMEVVDEMWVPCFVRGTPVMTLSGFSNIEDIKVGDFVYTHTGRFGSVSNTSCKSYTGTLYNIFSIEEATCTPEHPFLTASLFFKQEGGIKKLSDSFISWKNAENLVVGDYLCVPKIRFIEKSSVLDVVDIVNGFGYTIKDKNSTCTVEYGQDIFNVKSNKKIKIKQSRCLKVPSLIDFGCKLSRLLGYYLADGSQQSSKLHGINFVFDINEDTYVEDVVDCINKVFNLNPQINVRGNTKRVVVGSKVVSGLFKWMVRGKGKNKRLSKKCFDLILNSSTDIVRNFLVGYFNGDGHIEKNLRYISGFSVSKNLVGQVSFLSLKLGLLPSIKSDLRKKTGIVDKDVFGYRWYYGGSQVEKLRCDLSKHNNIGCTIERSRTQTFYSDEYYYYVPVKNIKTSEVKDSQVYNMEVLDDHSYIVNRSAVHNCNWNKEALINSGVTKPIKVIPHGIDPDMFSDVGNDSYFINGVGEDTFKFYSIFQWMNRKNPEGLIRSYFNAFGPDDDVVLILKTYLSGRTGADKQHLKNFIVNIKKDMSIDYYPKIILIGDLLSHSQMRGLHKYGDCYVSMHRGEGWGLPMFEAGLAGNPVIGTKCGGNLEFMSETDSYLVDCQMTYVSGMSTFNPWYLGNQRWAEPDQTHGSQLMRRVYDNREESKSRGIALRDKIKSEFSWAKVAEKMIQCLSERGK